MYNTVLWNGNLAWKLRPPAALAEDLGVLPITWQLVGICDPVLRELTPSMGARPAHDTHTYMQTNTQVNKRKTIACLLCISVKKQDGALGNHANTLKPSIPLHAKHYGQR